MKQSFVYILPAVLYAIAGVSAATLPDPTRPPDYSVNIGTSEQPPESPADFNLTATRIDKDNRSAIINGHLLRVGDPIGSAKLVEIHPAYVVLDYQQKRLVVRLYKQILKTARGTPDTRGTVN